jgi:hypothetical protein
MQIREMMEYQQNRDEYEGVEAAANSSNGDRPRNRPDGESSELSDGDENSDDDDDDAIMTPRGVYVQRVLYAPHFFHPMSVLATLHCFLSAIGKGKH